MAVSSSVTCPLCDRTLRVYANHFTVAHGDTTGALRIAVALAGADRVVVERSADAAEAGLRIGEIHVDDRIATAVVLLKRRAPAQALARLGISGTTAQRIRGLIAQGALDGAR